MATFKEDQMRAAIDWFESAGVNLFNFAVLCEGAMIGQARARAGAEVMLCLGWAGAKNAQGLNVYMRPARFWLEGQPAAWPIVFLDDVSVMMASRIQTKYATLTIQTSPNNCHLWIACKVPLSEAQRAAIQAALAKKIGADKASTSGEHFGRAPGFKNQKRGGAWVSIIKKTGGGKAECRHHRFRRIRSCGSLLPQGGACGSSRWR